MSKHQNRNAFLAILAHLGWPLLLGASLCSVFYVLVYRGPLNLPSVHRYFAAHPVLIIETGLFFVGLAALGLKAFEVLLQYWALNAVQLEEPPAAGQKIEDAGGLLQQLDQQSSSARQSYLGRRVRDVLQAIQRKGSADGLDEDLKYLADMDAARQQDSYGLVRIVIWATPMLGFLGTVVGITQALGDLDPQQLATNIQKAMEGLLSGLYVAFDTTALALSLSMVLMFIQFLLDRVESQALSLVDTQANAMLVGRFQEVGAGHDPYLASVERMSGRVLQASEERGGVLSSLVRSDGAGGDLLGALLGGAMGGNQSSGSGLSDGLDLGDLVTAGMAYFKAKQSGGSTMQALVQAFMAVSGMGSSRERTQSTSLVVSSFLEALKSTSAQG